MGKEGEALRRELSTAPPCLPVAPTTRNFLVAIGSRRCYVDILREEKVWLVGRIENLWELLSNWKSFKFLVG